MRSPRKCLTLSSTLSGLSFLSRVPEKLVCATFADSSVLPGDCFCFQSREAMALDGTALSGQGKLSGFYEGRTGCKTHPILCQVLSNAFRHAIPNRKDLWKASE